MLNAKGVLLHTTYNLLKASFWLVCSLEQGNITKRSGIQTKNIFVPGILQPLYQLTLFIRTCNRQGIITKEYQKRSKNLVSA